MDPEDFKRTMQRLAQGEPAAHVIAHVPPLQLAVPWFWLHRPPHVPQLSGSVATFTSQPFATSPSQSAKPAAHAMKHWPTWHAGVPFADEHA